MKHNKKLISKKIIFATLVCIFIISIVTGVMFNKGVDGYTYKDTSTGITWFYNVSGTNATNVYISNIGSFTGTKLTIPDTINGYTVTELRGSSTSSSNRYNMLASNKTNTTITEVVIPSTVKVIGINTFANFTKLSTVTIPDSTTTIGINAFYNCNALTTINFGTGNVEIGNNAFYNCYSISSLDLRNTISIGSYAFYNCYGITGTLTIPSTTTYLGTNAFQNCRGLTSCMIGSEVGSINSYAFNGCTGLTELTIGEKVTAIGTYAFTNCIGINKEIVIPDSVTDIGVNAFYNCSKVPNVYMGAGTRTIGTGAFKGMTSLEMIQVSEENLYFSSIDGVLLNKAKTSLIAYPRGKSSTNYAVPATVKEIGAEAFYYCTKLNGNLSLPSGLETISGSAFYECTGLSGKLDIPDTVTTIGVSAFYDCKNLSEIKFSNTLTTIGASAFFGCSSMKGDLIIPDSVATIGASAFYNCSSFDGNLYVGTGVQTINSNTFQGSANFYKATLSNGVKSVAYNAFAGFTDLWIENEESQVSLNTYFGGYDNTTYVHWLGCTHKVNVSSVPGVKIINADTLEEITSGDYECDTSINYKIQIEDGYNYDNLKLITISNNDDSTAKMVEVNTNETYKVERLIRDYDIYVQAISSTANFTVKTFITEKNRIILTDSREPVVSIKDGGFDFAQSKEPIMAKSNDLITCVVRVYNEGVLNGKSQNVVLNLPAGVALVEGNRTNTINGWTQNLDGTISTTILSDKVINGYSGTGTLDYEDITVLLQVVADQPEDEDVTYEIKANVGSKTDSEFVVLAGKIKVDYTVRINKIDSETKELLSGAEFELRDQEGNLIRKSETSEDGTLNFGLITTYGEGQDIYYVEETATPEGYMLAEKSKIKVVVTKSIVDEAQGTYAVAVTCEVLDYNTDTTRYEYTPIKTKEQLAKIGSGEKVIVDGVEYEYNTNTNYKLMEDIDLAGEEWTPISHEVKGIIDGDGHKISNLTITSTEEYGITEVGLFRTFSGIVENLELENVNINIQAISEDALTITGKPCVGGFSGYMKEGTIKNCKVSGNIAAVTDNIGGLVGHTQEGYILKIQNCTNDATVSGNIGTAMRQGVSTTVKSSNVGGLVGCALGALSITDCTNNGAITNTNYNVGGLVGFVQSTSYQEVSITADFNEADKIIDLVIENKKTSSKYDIILENLDAKTLGLVEGAVYTISDKNKNVIEGCERVQLIDGRLKVASVDIESLGVDTYYIQENRPAEGYKPLSSVIKLEIERYWDRKAEDFKVAVNTKVISDYEAEEDEPSTEERPISSSTGNVFQKVTFENVSWNVNKAEIKNSTNNGEITSNGMNAAGILGTSYCVVEIDNCENTGKITGNNMGKAAGIISENRTKGLNEFSKITNCTNSGSVSTTGNQSTGTAGIVAHTIGDIEITDCENSGNITGNGICGVSGILSDLEGTVIMENCINSGSIAALPEGTTISYSNINGNVGGMIAKNCVYSSAEKVNNNIYVNNCTSMGNINGMAHTGGIIGLTNAETVTVINCTVKDLDISEINGDKGGIIGNISSNSIIIDNCDITNTNIYRSSENTNSTYGGTGGVIGNLCTWQGCGLGGCGLAYTKISNCNVTDSTIKGKGGEPAGILGKCYGDNSTTNINIYDCVVERCEIENSEVRGTYSSAAGIFAAVYQGGNITIDSCLVNDTKINSIPMANATSGSDCNVGGIFGGGAYCNSITINQCYTTNCEISLDSKNDSCANAAGIVAFAGIDTSNAEYLKISKCNVENTNISNNSGNLGGIIATLYKWDNTNEQVITDCNVSGGSLISESRTSSNTCTGGIVGFMPNKIKLENCNVSDVDISGHGTNVGGIMGMAYYDATINDCSTRDSNITKTESSSSYSYTTNDCISAVLAFGYQKVDLNNIEVENCNVTGSQCSNVSGIVGCALNTVTMKNCNVKGSEMTSDAEYAQYTSNSSTAGLLSRCATASLDNCSIESSKINFRGCSTGGFVATGDSISITNSSITDLVMKDCAEIQRNPNTYKSVGGFAGVAISGTKLYNLNVKGLEIDSTATSTGGIMGVSCSLQQLEKCTVDDLTINSNSIVNLSYNGSSAGLIADITSATCDVKDCSVTNSSIVSILDNVGGLIGAIPSTTGSVSNCTVENTELTNKAENEYSYPNGNVGGLIAFASNININGCTVKDSNLNIKAGINHHLGGLIGFANDTTITDSKVSNTQAINSSSGNTGGLVGMTDYIQSTELAKTLTIKNSGIESSSKISGCNKVGGIIGFGKLISTTGYVKNSTVTGSTTSSEVGGAIGNGLAASAITEVDVSNSTITAEGRAAGIAGFAPMNITGCDVTSCNISTTGTTMEVGGIVANASNSSSEITKCNLTNTNITGNAGYIGGIAGFANNTISECNITNCIVKSVSTVANGLGGIVGHGSNFTGTMTYIYKCIVTGCELTGGNNVGGIAGSSVPTIEECSVIGNVTLQEDTTLGSINIELTNLETANVNENITETKENMTTDTDENMTTDTNSVDLNCVENTNTEETTNLNLTTVNSSEDEENVESSNEGDTETTKDTINVELTPLNLVDSKTNEVKGTEVYSSLITGQTNVGGIIGEAGQLLTGNTFTTLINCSIKGTQLKGNTNVSESIGKNSYYTDGETTIYDVITNFIKENCKLIIE